MNRSLIVGVCIAAIALVPVAAGAQEGPPPPPPPEYYQQQPPPPPPPQYYQPPPPQYYQPAPRYYVAPAYRPPPNGIGTVIAASIFLGVGIILVGVSIPLWQGSCGGTATCFANYGSSDYDVAAGAVTLDVFGGILFTLGAILLPIGIIQMSRYGHLRGARRVDLLHPQIELGHDVALSAGRGGLKLTF